MTYKIWALSLWTWSWYWNTNTEKYKHGKIQTQNKKSNTDVLNCKIFRIKLWKYLSGIAKCVFLPVANVFVQDGEMHLFLVCKIRQSCLFCFVVHGDNCWMLSMVTIGWLALNYIDDHGHDIKIQTHNWMILKYTIGWYQNTNTQLDDIKIHNWMIVKYKHRETWDCIGWWFLHWYLIWNIKNGYTELDNFDVYLLTRNQICTHCVRNYSEACTDVLRHQNRWMITEAAPLSIRRYWGEQRANSK